MAPPRKHDTDAILDAARALVLEAGPRAAGVAAIARKSGAPVGTLYHRFGNRDAILAAAWLRALLRFQGRALAAAADADDAVSTGAAMAEAVVEFAAEAPEDARLLLTIRRDDLLDSAPGPDLAERIAEVNDPLRAELVGIARELHGRADERTLEAVTRAVVDLPYSAVRRHGGAGRMPGWLGGDVRESTRLLLESI